MSAGTPTMPLLSSGTTPSGTSGWQVRRWRDGDADRLRRIDDLAFGHSVTDDAWAVENSIVEPERMIFVADPGGGDAVVGAAGAVSFDLSVPGGRSVRAAGVTWVSVSPTHRRQGILRTLMATQLADLARGDEPVAILWCSEATIYGRYGYGRASSDLRITVDRHRAAVDPALLPAAERLQAELVDPIESLGAVEAVYEAVRATRPGMPRRDATWQRVAVSDLESDREGASRLRVVLFRDAAGMVRAAARFRIGSWSGETRAQPRRTQVSELYADSASASAAAWSWIGQLDLVGGYRAGTRPVDDPLLLQLTDLRAATAEPGDALWARLVDLPAALAARGYAGSADVVVEVSDGALPANAGRWRIRTTRSGATVGRTDDDPDVSLDTAVLAQSYLGLSGSLVRSWHAGRVSEHRAGAVAELSRAFDSDLAPWCPVHF